MLQSSDHSRPYIVLSTESNPLTASLPKKTTSSPAERALQRFEITGNAIGQYTIALSLLERKILLEYNTLLPHPQ